MSSLLQNLGWTLTEQKAFHGLGQTGWYPARICRETKINYSVLAEGKGEHEVVLAGKLWHEAATDAELPTVGDWVAVDPGEDGQLPVIRAMLPRRNRFSRKIPGRSCAEQVIGANIDCVLVVTDALADFNPKRLERYLTLIRKSGARAVVLVNKADMTPPEQMSNACQCVAALAAPQEVEVYAVSALSRSGLPESILNIPVGRTVLVVGSSGVGKSTLVNTLLGEDRRETSDVNGVTGKGRHTTVARELLLLPGGGVLIDNPGMREVQMWTDAATLRAQFEDLSQLALQCRFSDCSHRRESGCAVREALATGALTRERYEHFLRLDAEIAELEKLVEKRRMTLERVTRRVKRIVLRNRDDREEQRRQLSPHRRDLSHTAD